MKYMDGAGQAGDVDHPECSSPVPDAYFSCARSDARHGFPVIRLLAMLKHVQLMTGIASGRVRKGAQVLERGAAERNGPGLCMDGIIQNFV